MRPLWKVADLRSLDPQAGMRFGEAFPCSAAAAAGRITRRHAGM